MVWRGCKGSTKGKPSKSSPDPAGDWSVWGKIFCEEGFLELSSRGWVGTVALWWLCSDVWYWDLMNLICLCAVLLGWEAITPKWMSMPWGFLVAFGCGSILVRPPALQEPWPFLTEDSLGGRGLRQLKLPVGRAGERGVCASPCELECRSVAPRKVTP